MSFHQLRSSRFNNPLANPNTGGGGGGFDPSLSAWQQPVNQPLRARVPKRMQVNKQQSPYPAAPSQAPYVSYWVQPVNQPLIHYRKPLIEEY